MAILFETLVKRRFPVNYIVSSIALQRERENELIACSELETRVRNYKLTYLFLRQNMCCGFSKEPSQYGILRPYILAFYIRNRAEDLKCRWSAHKS